MSRVDSENRKVSPMNFRRSDLNVVFVMLCLTALLPFRLSGQESIDVPFEIVGKTMGPIAYKVIIAHHPDSVTPQELQKRIGESLERVNGLMSTYLPDSDVSRFNTSRSTGYQEVALETATVIAKAIEISKQSNGAFDITVGPAVNLWNFGPNKKDFVLPTDEMIAEVKELVGFQFLDVRMNPPAIKKSNPSLQIDLSAIAKGYAVDQVSVMLDEFGCEKFMVEVGGEVSTRGERFEGGSWRIGVERPTEKGRALTSVAEISDRAMATSGDYRNFIEHGGKRFSHTIDPKTCQPVTHSLASACVVANDCMTADALATAIMVLGVDRGKQLCSSLEVDYLLVERDSDFGQDLTEYVSDSFPLISKSTTDRVAEQSIWPSFIGAAIIFGIAVLAMAVGSIFANKPVAGSCGGLANMANIDGGSECGVCSKPRDECPKVAQKSAADQAS